MVWHVITGPRINDLWTDELVCCKSSSAYNTSTLCPIDDCQHKSNFIVHLKTRIINALRSWHCVADSKMVWQVTAQPRTNDIWMDEVFFYRSSSAYNTSILCPMDNCYTNLKSIDHKGERDVLKNHFQLISQNLEIQCNAQHSWYNVYVCSSPARVDKGWHPMWTQWWTICKMKTIKDNICDMKLRSYLKWCCELPKNQTRTCFQMVTVCRRSQLTNWNYPIWINCCQFLKHNIIPPNSLKFWLNKTHIKSLVRNIKYKIAQMSPKRAYLASPSNQ